MKKCINSIRKASFTVEAAVIIPLSVTILALLLGFDYYTHQMQWCKGAAYESAFYALQRFEEETDVSQEAESRLRSRMNEVPLAAGNMTGNADEGITGLSVSWEAEIIPSFFGNRFMPSGEVDVSRICPAEIKRTQWVLGGLFE